MDDEFRRGRTLAVLAEGRWVFFDILGWGLGDGVWHLGCAGPGALDGRVLSCPRSVEGWVDLWMVGWGACFQWNRMR